jgi:hypothetical protein
MLYHRLSSVASYVSRQMRPLASNFKLYPTQCRLSTTFKGHDMKLCGPLKVIHTPNQWKVRIEFCVVTGLQVSRHLRSSAPKFTSLGKPIPLTLGVPNQYTTINAPQSRAMTIKVYGALEKSNRIMHLAKLDYVWSWAFGY